MEVGFDPLMCEEQDGLTMVLLPYTCVVDNIHAIQGF